MINPEYQKLPKTSVSRQYAVLQTFDGSQKYSFLVNPSTIEKVFSMSVAELPVLNTDQPLLHYRNSKSTVSLPDVKFYTEGNDRDLTSVLSMLTAWTRPDPNQGVPRLLKLTWGSQSLARCYLVNFRYTITQTRQGHAVEANGSMELALAPEPVPLRKEATGSTQLTIREQGELAKQIKATVAKDKRVRDKWKLSTKDAIAVTSDGTVQATTPKQKTRTVGKVRDILGDALKQSLR